MSATPDRHPGRHGAALALVLATKDLKVAWSYRLSFIFGHLTVIGSLVLFYFVSRVVGDSSVVGGPEEYFRFVVVGMALAGLLERAVGASMGAARRDQVEGTLEAVASLPVSSLTLGLGWMLYPMIDALIGLVVTFLLALPLGLSGIDPNWPAVVVSMTLSVVVFASMGFFGTSLVLGFQQGAGLVPLLLAALALFSGVLFPVSVMPEWLQTLAGLSPLKHALDAMRGALTQGASIADLQRSLLILVGFAVVLVPTSLAALEYGFRRARRTGGLSRF